MSKICLCCWLINLKPAFAALNFCTMSFMAVPIIFLIAMNLAKHNKVPEYITGVVAVAAYISVVPQSVTLGEQSTAGLAGTTLGAQGLFIGMIDHQSSSVLSESRSLGSIKAMEQEAERKSQAFRG